MSLFNAVVMLFYRLRSWPKINPTLLLFVGISHYSLYCCFNVGPPFSTPAQQLANIVSAYRNIPLLLCAMPG